MYAGRLDTRVTVQRPETTRDAWGGVVEGWGLVTSTWASVEPLQGREFIAVFSSAAARASGTCRRFGFRLRNAARFASRSLATVDGDIAQGVEGFPNDALRVFKPVLV